MGEVTSEGDRLIKAWEVAKQREERAKSELNKARCDVLNTTSALAKWLLPDDAKPGEKIAVWWGDSLIQASLPMDPNHDPAIEVRARGKHARERGSVAA